MFPPASPPHSISSSWSFYQEEERPILSKDQSFDEKQEVAQSNFGRSASCLRENLLTKNDTENDERRNDGKYLVEFYKNHVFEKANQVIDGARKNFSNKIEENSRSLLQELKCRFLERRSKKKGTHTSAIQVLTRMLQTCCRHR